MKIENPLAYSFIMQDELYLLNTEKRLHANSMQPLSTIADPTEIILPEIETKAISFKYLGSNKRAFLVIVHYTSQEFINDTHLTALTAVLGRLQHAIDEIAILNLANYAEAKFDALLGYFKPQKLLFLGDRSLPAGLGPIGLNKPQRINGIPALFSFSFDEMMTDNERKKMFWEQMKQL